MAATTPRNSGSGKSTTVNSPRSKRGAAARGIASPLVQVGESESIVSGANASSPASTVSEAQIDNSSPHCSPSNAEAAFLSSDSFAEAEAESGFDDSGTGNAVKKPAWNKPSNCTVDVGPPVMDAVSWPALSESARASPKSSSSPSQGSGIATSSPQKQGITNNTNPNLTPNHVTPTRQKSMRQSSGSSSGNLNANGGFPQPHQSLSPSAEMPANNTGKSGLVISESFPRERTHKESGQKGGFGSHSHSGNDHPQQRNSFRRGNGGPHPRSDGSYHHNFGGRRDQDRRNHEWNHSRSFNGRDNHMQPQRVVHRGFIRAPPPHSSAPFIPPPPMPVQPFGNPMVYPEVPPSVIYVPTTPADSLRGVPIVAQIPPHAMFFPVPDLQLHTKIVNQIDYYFSNENLIKDTFLRQSMDEQGWVPVRLIAGFKKVMLLTDNVQLILDAVHNSSIVEVQGDKVRKRDDWQKWIISSSVQFPTVSSPQSVGRSSVDILTASMQSASLEEQKDKQGQVEAFGNRSSSRDLNSQSQSSSREWTGQASVQAGSERSI